MNIWKTIVFILVLIVLGIGMYNLRSENQELERDVDSLSTAVNDLESENKLLLEKITYFRNPENLLKELKSQFNYREQGEEMIIIVPRTGEAEE
ncbi:MAG TPA: hypothetical protein ENH86_00785 [Candidatus Jorgensenbacteria bacterium]|uniref:Septum formation initiator n=1 Tax=marine sediment metagenome TaxID=412755 RepID=A0A0F9KQ46_9ZZZZ|nr:hypothetical protein [Candidatus Jorgensenbacteria bacterium]